MKTDWKYTKSFIGVTLSAALMLSALIYYVATSGRIENPGYDTSIYYELAKNILIQKKYWFNFQPHTIYPPGFPLILAGFISLFGDSYGMLTKANAAAGFIGIFGTFILFSFIKNWKYALIIVMIMVFSPLCYFWITAGLSSDAIYFSFSISIFICLEVYLKSKKNFIKAICFGCLILLSGYIVVVRSIGTVIIIAFLCWSLCPLFRKSTNIKDSFRQRLFIAIPPVLLAIAITGSWNIWTKNHKTVDYSNYYMNSYMQQILKKDPQIINSANIGLKDFPQRITKMAAVRGANLIKNILGIGYVKPNLTHFPVFCVIALIFTGLAHSLIESDRLFDWYVLVYAGIIIIYPFNEEGRYLFPILPFLLYYLYEGALVAKKSISANLPLKNICILLSALFALLILNIWSITTSGIFSVQDLLSIGLWVALIAGIYTFKVQKNFRKIVEENNTIMSIFRTMLAPLIGFMIFAVLSIGALKIANISAQNLSESIEKSLQSGTMLAANWVRDNTKPDDVIMCEHFAIMHHLTKRKSHRFPLTMDPKEIILGIEKYDVDYIIVLNKKEFEYYTPSVEDRFCDMEKKYDKAFCLCGEINGGKIYKVDKNDLKNIGVDGI